MSPYVILSLLLQLALNASYAGVVAMGILAANLFVYIANRSAHGESNRFQIFVAAIKSCWPVFVFCAIVPVTAKFATLLALGDVCLAVVVGIMHPDDRKWLEHFLAIVFLVATGVIVAVLTIHAASPRSAPPLGRHLFLDMLWIGARNALGSIPILIGLGASGVITRRTNKEAHETLFLPQWNRLRGSTLTWENYRASDAFLAALCADFIGLGCLVYCIIIPISWQVALIVGDVLVALPIIVALADHNARVDIEFRLVFICNAIACAAYVLSQ